MLSNIVFECCIGKCNPINRGNIDDIYYVCDECNQKQVKEDEEKAISNGYINGNGNWVLGKPKKIK